MHKVLRDNEGDPAGQCERVPGPWFQLFPACGPGTTPSRPFYRESYLKRKRRCDGKHYSRGDYRARPTAGRRAASISAPL